MGQFSIQGWNEFYWSGNYTYTIDSLANTFTISVSATLTNTSSSTIVLSGSPVVCNLTSDSSDREFKNLDGYNFGYIIETTTPRNINPGESFNISGSKTFNLKGDGTTGSSTGEVKVEDGGVVLFSLGEVKSSNGNIKTNGTWKPCCVFHKINGIWKRCILWKKINGVWKK